MTEFIDNGRGLPDEGVDRIFDAFVSTKENGMGVGLAISRSIIEAYDGELWVVNNPEFTATFGMLLNGPSATARPRPDDQSITSLTAQVGPHPLQEDAEP